MKAGSRPCLIGHLVLAVVMGWCFGCRAAEVDEPAPISAAMGTGAESEEWSQWRGTGRDAVIPDYSRPSSWPESLRQVWSTEVGAGYSSPIASGSAAYIHTRREDRELVAALALETGEFLGFDFGQLAQLEEGLLGETAPLPARPFGECPVNVVGEISDLERGHCLTSITL